MCAPTSEPFSSTTTESSGSSCFRRIAADEARRAGADDDHVVLHRLALDLGHRHPLLAVVPRVARCLAAGRAGVNHAGRRSRAAAILPLRSDSAALMLPDRAVGCTAGSGRGLAQRPDSY